MEIGQKAIALEGEHYFTTGSEITFMGVAERDGDKWFAFKGDESIKYDNPELIQYLSEDEFEVIE